MNNEKKKPVQTCETILRDVHQSLFATGMATEEVLPIIDKMNTIGYRSVECWGGAMFGSCLHFLREDPWQRPRLLKQDPKNIKLQMLFRGQNVLSYDHYTDDVAEYFVRKSVVNGIDILRTFDYLDDFRNLEAAINACKEEGMEAQIALSYTLGDAYTLEYWVRLAKRIEEMRTDSICIKDVPGLLTPYEAYDLAKTLKESIKPPIDTHTHYTSGAVSTTLLKTIRVGTDIIDTAISPLAFRTSQLAMEAMVQTLKGTSYDTGPNTEKLSEITEYLTKIHERYIVNGPLSPRLLGVNVNTLRYQIPGDMLSNLLKQLTEAYKENSPSDVFEGMARVRKDFGEPSLITLSSQAVDTQAVMNVPIHQRYKMISKESRKLVMGEFGRSVCPVNPEIQKQIISDEKPITCRPTDLVPPQLPKFKEEVGPRKQQERDVLPYALFPQVALDFFKYRQAQQSGVDMNRADTANGVHPA